MNNLVCLIVVLLLPFAGIAKETPISTIPFKLIEDGILFFKTVMASEDKWAIVVQKDKKSSLETLTVYSVEKKFSYFSAKASSVTSSFLDAKMVQLNGYSNSLLVTQWNQGAHAKSIKVFDPAKKEKALLYEVESAETLDYGISSNHLIIYEENSENGKDWYPPGVKAPQADTP